MPRPVLYLGPSLPRAHARHILEAEYLPPIKRGDLAILPPDVEVVGIIDGEFYQSLAVTPKEILELLERGITVYGASSMGALRAAELHPYGMVGIGEIFRMYTDGVVDADDEVAQLYSPVTLKPHSEPLINIRHALSSAVYAGIINEGQADKIIRQLKAVYFPARSYDLVRSLCPTLDYFLHTAPNLKRQDAILLLEAIKISLQTSCSIDS